MSGVHPAGQLFQLDRSRCLALLATHRVGRLFGGNNESPVVVINYALRGNDIVVRVDTESPAVTVGTEVTFEVDDLDERTRSGWSVIVRGVARDVIGEPSVRILGRRHVGTRTQGSVDRDPDGSRDRAPPARGRRRDRGRPPGVPVKDPEQASWDFRPKRGSHSNSYVSK